MGSFEPTRLGTQPLPLDWRADVHRQVCGRACGHALARAHLPRMRYGDCSFSLCVCVRAHMSLCSSVCAPLLVNDFLCVSVCLNVRVHVYVTCMCVCACVSWVEHDKE